MMKNRHLSIVISTLCILFFSPEAYCESVEVGHPLPGRVRIVATALGTSKRIQISGSLKPLRVFINGQERSAEFKRAECTSGAVSFNGAQIETQGGPGVFYWEGIQNQEELSLNLNDGKNCKSLVFSIPLAFFEKGFKQVVYLPESEAPSSWKIKLTGEKLEGVNLTMDQGSLELGSEWSYSHEIRPGETVVTGLLKDQQGNVTPLLLKFNLEIQTPQSNLPGLIVSYVQEEIDEVEIQGKINTSNKLLINDEVMTTQSDGSFSMKLSLKEGENPIKVVALSENGEEVSASKNIVREVLPDVIWPILPEGAYLGIAPISMHAFKPLVEGLRVQETPVSHLILGLKLGQAKRSWEFHIRHVDRMEVFPRNNSNNMNPDSGIAYSDHFGIGALRLLPWKKAFHVGFGMSYEEVKRSTFNDSKKLRGIHIIGRIGWMKTFGQRWAWMVSIAPFVPIPFGEKWETFGFDLIPVTVLYTF